MHTEEKALPMRRIHRLIFRCLQRIPCGCFFGFSGFRFCLPLCSAHSSVTTQNVRIGRCTKPPATFTVNVVGMSGASASYYSKSTAEQFARTFPYILTSGVLRNLICEDLKLKTLPASINAYVEGTTTLFTLETTAADPELAYKVLVSAIDKYPQVANYVVGNTELTLISPPAVPSAPYNSLSYASCIKKGAALGILLGIAVAVIAAATRKTVRSTAELKSILNLRCIGHAAL